MDGLESKAGEVPDLVPARMLNEFVYCPRLAYLEWVHGEFAHSVDTVSGHYVHRRVDKGKGSLPEKGAIGDSSDQEATGATDNDEQGKVLAELAEELSFKAGSVLLSDHQLGLIARIDLVEGQGRHAVPVDYKKGTAPDLPEGAWDTDRVQICAQALLLRAAGYECTQGIAYYAGSRKRVTIAIDDALVSFTHDALDRFRLICGGAELPDPLEDSGKCIRCSLAGICLPDEIHFLKGRITKKEDVRRILAARDDALPMYIQSQGNRVGMKNGRIEVRSKGELLTSVRPLDVCSLSIFGNIQVTSYARRELLSLGIPILHLSYGGWFYGITQGMSHKNVTLRLAQYSCAMDGERSLDVARQIVTGKIRNCRTLLRRNHGDLPDNALKELARLCERAAVVSDMETLLGIEGYASKLYFGHFAGMFKTVGDDKLDFMFEHRNRRPPRDPVNAMLSFGYSLLVKDLTVAVLAVGFDPYLGLYHQPRYGRPALALDMMEEFRPLIVDSVVLSVINNRELQPRDFYRLGAGCTMKDRGASSSFGLMKGAWTPWWSIQSSGIKPRTVACWRYRPVCWADI